MSDTSFLDWPFFDDSHRALAARVRAGAEREIAPMEASEPRGAELDQVCVALVRKLGEAGWLRSAIPSAYGGASDALDVRSLCIIRETLASYSGIADFVFALQGLGAGPITLFGSDDLKRPYRQGVRSAACACTHQFPTVKALQDHAKSEIAPYKYPRAIEFVDALPHTDTGKLQRFRLREIPQ